MRQGCFEMLLGMLSILNADYLIIDYRISFTILPFNGSENGTDIK